MRPDHVRPDRRTAVGAVLAAAVVGLPLSLVATTAAPAAAVASASPITIAYVTDLTGEGGSENSTSPAGFDARIAMQNAEGGVNGHKLVPLVIDDQTSPSQIATAVQEADSKAFGIVSQSPLLFLAAKYPKQAGVPVTGTYDDGPEWGTQPYTNMFASDEGSVNPKYPVNTQIGNFLKAARRHGARLVRLRDLAVLEPGGHRRPPTRSSTRAARSACSTPPCPSAAWTSPATALVPSRRTSTRWCRPWTPTRTTPWPQALKQAGVKLKATLFATGYQPDVINSPAWNDPAGRLLPVAVPPVVAAQRRHPADAGRHGEVRALHQEPVPELRPVRGVGGGRPHDQGPPDGGAATRRGRPSSRTSGAQVLQRQRPAAPVHQLLHDLRARPAQAVHLGHAGREDRLQGGVVAAVCGTDIPGTSTACTS